MEEKLRIIVSGGGTGGHIFPAVSIANAIKELYPDTEILLPERKAEGKCTAFLPQVTRLSDCQSLDLTESIY